MNFPSYTKIAKVEGNLKGATISWESEWNGPQPAPNVLPSGEFCMVTNQAVEGMPFVMPNSGVLTLRPKVVCGENVMELDPLTLNVGLNFVEPKQPCCVGMIDPSECRCDMAYGIVFNMTQNGSDDGFFQGATVDHGGNLIGFGGYFPEVDRSPTRAAVVKYSPNGELVWGRALEKDYVYGELATVDKDNNIYFIGNSDYNGINISDGYSSAFLIKIAPDGSKLFEKELSPGSGIADIGSLCSDATGIVWACSYYSPSRRNQYNSPTRGTFVAKLSFDGSVLWTKSWTDEGASGTSYRAFGGLAVDGAGYIYVCTGGHVAKLDSDGQVIFTVSGGNFEGTYGGFDEPSSMAVTDNGYLYIMQDMGRHFAKLDRATGATLFYGVMPYNAWGVRAHGEHVFFNYSAMSDGIGYIAKLDSGTDVVVSCLQFSPHAHSWRYTTSDGSINITGNKIAVGGYGNDGTGRAFCFPVDFETVSGLCENASVEGGAISAEAVGPCFQPDPATPPTLNSTLYALNDTLNMVERDNPWHSISGHVGSCLFTV